MARLRSVGAPLATENSDDAAGLSVALGGGGMSLAALTNLYAGLGRSGTVLPLRQFATDPPGRSLSLLSSAAAAAVADILADTPPPPGIARRQALDGGRRIAFKTGTSYGFRDAWAVGFDSTHAVGVWIGRPDGAPHLGSYGITAAAPAMMRVFDLLPTPARAIDAGAVPGALASGRDLPSRLQRFTGAEAGTAFSILFPRDGAVVSLGVGAAADGLPVTAAGGAPPYQWFVDGTPVSFGDRPAIRWVPESGGQYQITVVDADGNSARSSFWLEPFASGH
jgi:penicillin-binding protein 1C